MHFTLVARRALRAVVADDDHLDARHRSPDRGQPGPHGRVVALVAWRDGRRDRARSTVLLVSVSPYAFTKPVSGNRCSARSSTGAGVRPPPYARWRSVGTRRDSSRLHGGDDPGQHRRHDERVRHLLVARRDDPLLGREARERDDAAPHVGGAEHRGDARDVERRHREQDGFVLVGGRELDRVEDVGQELVVLEHRRLRRRRGAAREQQDRGSFRVVGEGTQRGRAGRGGDPGRVVVDHDGGLEPLDQLRPHRVGEPEVHRRVAHARPRGAEQRHRQHRSVRQREDEARGAGPLEAVRRAATRRGAGRRRSAPPDRLPIATRSPRPSAAMSSSIARFT